MENNELKMEKNYPFFGFASLIYAVFFTFCLYENEAGITFPFFTAGTLFYFVLCMRKLGISAKKDSLFYFISVEALGISTFLTGDGRIIFMNYMAIFCLVIGFLLHTVYDDRNWDFGKYIGAMFQTVFCSLSCIFKPIEGLFHYLDMKKQGELGEENKETGKVKYIFLGLVICIPLVFVVLLLLVSADAVVYNMFSSIFSLDSIFKLFGDTFACGFLTVFAFFGSYMLVCYLNRKKVSEEVKNHKTGEPVLAITISAVLSVIYLIFSFIQILYLFIGGIAGGMSLPEGMTYAQYAREGFFQLLFVCLLNLVIVLVGLSFFRDNKVLKGLLCVITFCTYIMIASSALRMIMYIQYKYLTFLRIFVLWSLLVIFLCLTGVVIRIFNEKFPLFKFSMIVLTVLYLILSFSHPDYFIAKVNIDNMKVESQYAFFKESEPYDDYYYLVYDVCSDGAALIIDEDVVKTMEKGSEYWYSNRYSSTDIKTVWQEMYAVRMNQYEVTPRTFNLSQYLAKIRCN